VTVASPAPAPNVVISHWENTTILGSAMDHNKKELSKKKLKLLREHSYPHNYA
jgi:hypothetical protein